MKTITESCLARVGLMGNPSDGFHGKTISFLIDNFQAEVSLTEQESDHGFILREDISFGDSNELLLSSKHAGYSSGLKLLQATCTVFFRMCAQRNLDCVNRKSFLMTYSTNIPRMVGLSGSSAIVVAAFNALLKFYDLSLDSLGIRNYEYPSIILSIEKDELGITAGLQDRVVQCYGGLVYMDFTSPPHGVYTRMDPHLLPQMYLAYNIQTGGDSGKVHSTVKERWMNGDQEVIDGMKSLATYADQARDCLLERNFVRLANLMKLNFSMRRKLYGDNIIGLNNIDIVTLADSLGLAAKFCGSGGAIICLRIDGNGWYDDEREKDIREAFLGKGFEFVRLLVSVT